MAKDIVSCQRQGFEALPTGVRWFATPGPRPPKAAIRVGGNACPLQGQVQRRGRRSL